LEALIRFLKKARMKIRAFFAFPEPAVRFERPWTEKNKRPVLVDITHEI